MNIRKAQKKDKLARRGHWKAKCQPRQRFIAKLVTNKPETNILGQHLTPNILYMSNIQKGDKQQLREELQED